MPRFCNDCEFFCPSDGLRDVNDLTGCEVDEGECRRNPPEVGDIFKLRDGDEGRGFGNFPRVLTDDWCGGFSPCARAISDRHVASCNQRSGVLKAQNIDEASQLQVCGRPC